ncbi:head decoration protein [Anaeroselena agilis]|uniref:Head decoration protein n=1 Tax=Anaeroselena agilis TaxID=3063788 RepID=A0ABU3NYG2_9FIRM|nr:head decoration protein [Selenomonadales bacterium 4137-cl]
MAELVKTLNTFAHDALIGGTEIPLLTKAVTLAAGSGTVARGTVLGKITIGAASVAVAGAGEAGANTGNGTLTIDATTPVLAGAKPGVYQVKIVSAAVADPAAAAMAHVFDPDGDLIDIIEAATTPGTTFSKQIKFVIVDGSTAFVAGDGFTVTLAAGSGKHKTVDSTAVDGSAVADCIAVQTVVVPADADAKGEAYTQGIFNGDHLIFGGSDTMATHADRLRELNIIVTNEQ